MILSHSASKEQNLEQIPRLLLVFWPIDNFSTEKLLLECIRERSFLELWQLLFYTALSKLLSQQSSSAWFQCILTYYLNEHDKKLPWSYIIWHQITADSQDDPADLFSFYLTTLRQRSFYSIGNQVGAEIKPVVFHAQQFKRCQYSFLTTRNKCNTARYQWQ